MPALFNRKLDYRSNPPVEQRAEVPTIACVADPKRIRLNLVHRNLRQAALYCNLCLRSVAGNRLLTDVRQRLGANIPVMPPAGDDPPQVVEQLRPFSPFPGFVARGLAKLIVRKPSRYTCRVQAAAVVCRRLGNMAESSNLNAIERDSNGDFTTGRSSLHLIETGNGRIWLRDELTTEAVRAYRDLESNHAQLKSDCSCEYDDNALSRIKEVRHPGSLSKAAGSPLTVRCDSGFGRGRIGEARS